MRARIVPALHGARWLGDGWRLVRAAPFLSVGALAGCVVLMTVMVRIPLLGAPLFAILTPALWAALMAAARVASGEGAAPGDAARELQHAARPLALLGAVYLVANVAAFAATMPFGQGLLAGWVLFGRAPTREVMVSPEFFADVVLAMLFYVPAMFAFWFSPMLVAWHRMGAAKALFFSITACFLCWRAFSVYGLVAALMFFAVSAFVSVAVSMLVESAGVTPEFAMMAVLPVFMAYACALIASMYACYRDVFAAEEATIHP